MPRCILHVGMQKTGTTSIQDSLYHGLADPRFRYVSLGHVNSAIYLETLFSDSPEAFWLMRMKRLSAARVRAMKRGFEPRLRRALRQSKAHSRTPIISAERCWNSPEADLERLRDFLGAEGFEARVVAYLRPAKSWIESHFQQSVKLGAGSFDPLLRARGDAGERPYLHFERLRLLERVFGGDSLQVRPFVRSKLLEGCVVRDFCGVVGIALDPKAVVRSNGAISVDAVRLLYAFNRFRPNGSAPTFGQRFFLMKQLEEVPGDPLRFHSGVVAPVAAEIASQARKVQDRYGIDLSEVHAEADGGACIREEADLFRFSRASLEWLAAASGSARAAAGEGESAARAVASQVSRMLRRPCLRARLSLLRARARTELRWLLHGD